jgi:chemotaxis-related protein WspB
LMLVFGLGDDRYAVEAGSVVEIIPSLELRKLPHAPDFVAGIFNYHGAVVPVIDLLSLTQGRSCPDFLSTRILLVRHSGANGNLLGLRAEHVTETLEASGEDLVAPGIFVRDAPYLGNVLNNAKGMIQCIRVEHLLPDDAMELFFPEPMEKS